MNPIYNRLSIIDGSYFLNRALCVPNFADMTNSNEERIGGVFGFLRSISADIIRFKNYFPVVVFDSGLSQRRLDLDYNYKGNDKKSIARGEKLDESIQQDNYGINYKLQRDILIELLPYSGIPVIIKDSWEGDDLIYAVKQICNSCVILSEDKDMWQLIDNNCKVYRPMSKQLIDLGSITNNLGYTSVHEFLTEKIILGDFSDNIPTCCSGIGKATVKGLISYLNLFKPSLFDEIDASQLPKSEKDVKVVCNENNIPYRKAYLNFDYDRYLTNKYLIDLSYVNVPRNVSFITSPINDVKIRTDRTEFISRLKDKEIEFDTAMDLCNAVKSQYVNLFKSSTLF